MEVCVAKPGYVYDGSSIMNTLTHWVLSTDIVPDIPSTTLVNLCAAMLHQVLHGFEKEPLLGNDLTRIGKEALKGWESSNADIRQE